MAGTAMKIRWVLRHNPQNRLLPPKYYAAPVFAGRRDAVEMIRQIAGRSVLSAGDIVVRLRMPEKWLPTGIGGRLFGGIAGNRQFAPGIFERGF